MKNNKYNPHVSKYPTNKDSDWLGIEIECYLKDEIFETDCKWSKDRLLGCHCLKCCGGQEDYIDAFIEKIKENNIPNVHVSEDGSLYNDGEGYFGIEVKVLTQYKDMSNLKQICELLNECGAMVDSTCGLHVHLDMRNTRDETRNRLVKNLVNALPLLKLMMPNSRLNNQYCREGTSNTARHVMVNRQALSKFGTIEMRLHSGSTSYEKISEWCNILMSIKKARKVIECKTNFKDFVTSFKLKKKTINYMKQRISKFNVDFFPRKVKDRQIEEMSE